MFEEIKNELRAQMKAQLSKQSADVRRAKSDAAVGRLLKQKAYRKAKTIMAYASFGTELETDRLLEQILKDGKKLVLPRLNPFDKTLIPHEVTNLEKDLVVHKLGFREPLPNPPVFPLKKIPCIIVPGLAFDEFGERLGRGLGCYDKLLAKASHKIDFVALAFDIQILDDMEIPSDFNDMPMDLILTETRRIDPGDALEDLYQQNKDIVDAIVDELPPDEEPDIVAD